jgi:hypothetical protein
MLPDIVKKLLGIQSPSRVFHALGLNISQGLMNGLNAGKQGAIDAVGRMADAVLKKAQGVLDGLKKQRDAMAKSVAATTLQGAGLSNINADPTTGRVNIVAGLQQQAAKFRNFTRVLKTLKSMGLNAALYAQIVNMGPDSGTDAAQALIASGKTGVAQANSAWNSVSASATSLGRQVANDTFGKQIADAMAKVESTRKLVAEVHVYLDGIHVRSTANVARNQRQAHHTTHHGAGHHTTVHVHVTEPVDPHHTARRIGAILDKGIASGAYKPTKLVTR